jgi:hypothetical protein
MLFLDSKHEEFFSECLKKSNREGDSYHRALFYVLGLTAETRRNIDTLYHFKNKCIEFDDLNAAWQTGTSTRVTRLAFNLFNGFTGINEEDAYKYTLYNLFDTGLMIYMLEGIKLLYPCYTK